MSDLLDEYEAKTGNSVPIHGGFPTEFVNSKYLLNLISLQSTPRLADLSPLLLT